MTITESSTYYITVNQENKRKFRKDSEYKYSDV